jgi:hypothetical protein
VLLLFYGCVKELALVDWSEGSETPAGKVNQRETPIQLEYILHVV